MTALIGAVRSDADMTVFILDNGTVAMTGTQESFTTGEKLLDVLTGLPEIKLGVRYVLRGKEVYEMPASLRDLSECVVEYETYPGWTEDISKCTRFEELPGMT